MVKKKTPFKEISITVFIAGAVLMGLEIIGGRLLAPYYGNSVYVWGSIISIFLIALSAGYYLGGYLADRYPTKKYLSNLILINVLTILPITFVYKPVVDFFGFLPFILQPLVTSFILFLIPSVIIGTVSPYAIKLTVKDLKTVGQVSGSLYSISTIGSVVGTLVTTFIFTLFFTITASLFILAFLLLILFFYLRNLNIFLVISIILFILYTSLSIQTQGLDRASFEFDDSVDYLTSVPYTNLTIPLHVDINSPYGLVSVRDRDRVRTVTHNGGDMGAVNIDSPTKQVKHWEYLSGIEVVFAYNPNLKTALTIGLASGTLQRNLLHRHNMTVSAVDINPVMVDVTKTYFGIGDHIEGLSTFVNDGRVFIQNTNEKYDLIVVDVAKYDQHNSYVIPFHLVTKEFYEITKQRLNKQGVFVKNIPMSSRDEDFLKSVMNTMSLSFETVDVYEFADCCKIIIATDLDSPISSQIYQDVLDTKRDNFDFRDSMVFTDGFAPVDDFRKIFVSS